MLYPLIIATLASEELEETRRRAERARRVRQVRDENRSAAAPGKSRRRPRLVTLRVAEPATRFPR